MSLDPSARQSRRVLLTTGLGGLAALVAAALGRPAPVRATLADGDVVLGGVHEATTTTSIANSTNDNAVFASSSTHAGTGVHGSSRGGIGVQGHSLGGPGVMGLSLDMAGVSGRSDWGPGVSGVSRSEAGVLGRSKQGPGVYAESIEGNALRVQGRVSFSQSGRAKVAAGRSHVDVTVLGGFNDAELVVLRSDESILAVLQTRRSGVYVSGVRKNYPSDGMARIYLNKVASASSSTVVAWLVIGTRALPGEPVDESWG